MNRPFLYKTIDSIKAWFTDKDIPQDEIYKPLAKLEKKPPLQKQEGETLAPCFKNLIIQSRFRYMHPVLQKILMEMVEWVEKEFKFTPVITETVTLEAEDLMLKRVSKSHQEGRAFDMRTLGWSEINIDRFKSHFNQKYGHLGAISARSGKLAFIVHHNAGTGPHFHVQINSGYQVKDLVKLLTERRLG